MPNPLKNYRPVNVPVKFDDETSAEDHSPFVVAVMLTRNRRAMAERAIGCFLRQTHEHRALLIVDSSPNPEDPASAYEDAVPLEEIARTIGAEYMHLADPPKKLSTLMRLANDTAMTLFTAKGMRPDVLVKWDDDDWSHPARITNQLETLTTTGVPCVGFNRAPFLVYESGEPEVWFYSNSSPNFALGTSLMISSGVWEKYKFPDTHTGFGSDTSLVVKLASHGLIRGVSAIAPNNEPMIIATIHGGNASCKTHRKGGFAPASKPLAEWVMKQREGWHTK